MLEMKKCVDKKMGYRPISNELGVSMLEFAIVLPVFLILIFACIDFARYSAAKSVLTTGAHRAVSLATVVPDLDLDIKDLPIGSTRIDDAKDKVIVAAKKIPEATLFSFGRYTGQITLNAVPKLDLPIRKNNESMISAMQRDPIRVSMEGSYDPFLPLLPILDIKSEASGFREPRTITSMPIPIDCFGNRLGSKFFKSTCDCYDPYSLNPTSGVCECIVDDDYCPGDQIALTNGQCGCSCPGNLIIDGAGCGCTGDNMNPTPIGPSKSKCECVAGFSCTAPKLKDELSCECRCPVSSPDLCKGSGGSYDSDECKCSLCPAGKSLDTNQPKCVCKAPVNCTAPEVFSNAECRCVPKE